MTIHRCSALSSRVLDDLSRTASRRHLAAAQAACCGRKLRSLTSAPHRQLSGGPSEVCVGFIGLGNMGSFMVKNLIKAGHDVMMYDAVASKAATMADATGARSASSLHEVASNCSSIITMLPNTPHVEDVYLGKKSGRSTAAFSDGGDGPEAQEKDQHGEGLIDLVEEGTLLVDSSTIDPLTSKTIGNMATRKGAVMIDAPVSGGVPAAASGTLTFIVGGSEEGVERARPLLDIMGKNVVHCGGSGSGCVAKICNNLCLAISMIGVSEAMSLGSKLGMDPKVLASVMNTSSGRCWSSDAYNPCPGVMENVPASRGYRDGFVTPLMEKDLHLALQAARWSSQSLPMGALAQQLYSLSSSANRGDEPRDFSSIYELIAGPEKLPRPKV